MKCKFCGKEIENGSTFCGYCGKKQPQVKFCIKCGHEIGLDDKWCGYCGADQSAVLTEKGTSDKSVQNEEPINAELTEHQEQANNSIEPDNIQANNDTIQEENTTESEYIEEEDSPNRKYLIIGVVATIIIACVVGYFTFGSRTDSQAIGADSIVAIDTTVTNTTAQNAQTADPTPDIKDAAFNVYKDVSAVNSDGMNIYNEGDIIEKSSSADLKKCWKAFCDKPTDDGEVGAIDWDIFTQAQDFDNFSYEIESVKLKDNNTAEVLVSMTNCGEKSHVTLIMVKEDGYWVIDDVIGHQTGSTKKIMKDNS